MQRIHRRHRLGGVAIVAGLALSALFAATVVDPSGASAPNQSNMVHRMSNAAHGHRAGIVHESAPVNPWAVSGGRPATLEHAGWDCPFVVHAVHCLPPGGFEGISTGTAEAVTALVFEVPAEHGTVEHATFLGTELNIRADLFQGQPCPTDPPSREYTSFSDIGLPFPYYACHRFDSPL